MNALEITVTDMSDADMSDVPPADAARSKPRAAWDAARYKQRAAFSWTARHVRSAWFWFRVWRRTRPFWGGLFAVVGGLEIIKMMSFSAGLALTGGWSYSAGYVMGGALALFGLCAWFAPHYKGLVGILAFLVALGAFPAANLGGFLVGSALGVVGGSMIWGWGDKKPSRRERRAVADPDEPVEEAASADADPS